MRTYVVCLLIVSPDMRVQQSRASAPAQPEAAVIAVCPPPPRAYDVATPLAQRSLLCEPRTATAPRPSLRLSKRRRAGERCCSSAREAADRSAAASNDLRPAAPSA